MRHSFAAAFVFLIFRILPASGGEMFEAGHCKDLVAKISDAFGARLDHVALSGESVLLQYAYKSSMVITCGSRQFTGVSVNWDDTGVPSNSWLMLVAKAGNLVTGAEVRRLQPAISNCLRSARKGGPANVDVTVPNAKIECQFFGEGLNGNPLNVNIWLDDNQA